MTAKTELIKLYANKSKHSNYQILPTRLEEILSAGDVQTSTRHEPERLAYMLEKVDVQDKTVLDIGGNTGYFSFEFLDAGARRVHCYEGNKEHAEFVRIAAEALGAGDKVRVSNNYFSFRSSQKEHYDFILLLNVLHHVGDDYGNQDITVDEAKKLIIEQLNSLSSQADVVIFQLGFNWHGNINRPLFANGTKREMIDFVRLGTRGTWREVAIGIAEKQGDKIVYNDLNDKNIERDNSLGEFLNRPIFILTSNA